MLDVRAIIIANFASTMTPGIDDMLYTKEGTLATVNDIMIPVQELTLEQESSESEVPGELGLKTNTMRELTQSCEEGSKLSENNNKTINIKVSDKETSCRAVNNIMRQLTQSCVLTVDTFSEDTSNIFSYPEPVQSFEEICNGIKKELYREVVKKSEAKLFNTIDDVRVKRAILIAAKKTMDIFEKERIEHDDNIQERVEDSIQDEKEDPECERLFAEESPKHYSEFIKQSDLIQWLKYFAIQGIWDLGCKDA